MLSCLPAKLLDYAIVPAKYEVEATDSFSSTDYIGRRFGKSLLETGYLSDASSIKPCKSLADSMSSTDYMTKTISIHLELRDTPRINDFVHKRRGVRISDTFTSYDWVSKSIVMTHIDTFIGEFYIGKGMGKNVPDTLKTMEVIVKDATKNVYDSGYLGDFVSKHMLKILRDEQAVSEYLKKKGTKPFVEKLGATEIVTKVGYTLTTERIPRVYFLPDQYKDLWDIAEEEYHNVKVDACRRLYKVFQWIRKRILGLKYPGALRETIGVRDYVSKKVTIARRDRLEYDFALEKSR
ncbi:MAG: hypothetical protein LZ173_01400 [Thaumarchaeota archaeon]|jgi:hypothetical protein|nr:hypothetical protein [Candidatus Geocrenenecus arthurdayi]